MQDEAEKLAAVIIESQKPAQKLCAAGSVRGMQNAHAAFWKLYEKIQLHAYKLIEAVEIYEQNSYQKQLPYHNERFTQMWHKYIQYYYEQTGTPLSTARAEIQLDLLTIHYQTADEAVNALKYIINKGYTHIFKVNYDDAAKQPQSTTSEGYEFE